MRTWTAQQTRQLPALAAALFMDRPESAYCGKPEAGNHGQGEACM